MANRWISPDEMHKVVDEVITEVCEKEGISREGFIKAIVECFNNKCIDNMEFKNSMDIDND